MKKILSVILTAALLLSLAACGVKNGNPADSGNSAAAAPVSKNGSDEISEDGADGISELKDSVTGRTFYTHNNAVILHPDSSLEKKDEYSLNGMYSEVITDRAIDMGWEYYYVDTAEDNVPIKTWSAADNHFTTLVMFSVVNLSEKPLTFADKVDMKIVYDEGGENEKTVEGTVFQTNPGQVSEEGYEETRSTVFNEIKKDEKTNISCLMDIDRETHDAFVAEDFSEPTWAYIDFENGDRYCVNLREDMVLFGYDDSDSESQITSDIHRTMKAATGAEFFEEFLTGNADFAEIAKKSGIDIKEAAKRYADLFSIKVTGIDFDTETTATAYCTVEAPDFVQMYRNLDKLGDEKFKDTDKSKLSEDEFYKQYGALMLDYLTDDNFPFSDMELNLEYVYKEGTEQWVMKNKKEAEDSMRTALINF